MKEIPILFSTPMVQAVIRDVEPKTVTRRTRGLDKINVNPDDWRVVYVLNSGNEIRCINKDGITTSFIIKCPYGVKGDTLWVREAFSILNKQYIFKTGEKSRDEDFKWKPSIHMPKDACRIWLENVKIHPERLHNITNEQAFIEGIFYDDVLEGYVSDNSGSNFSLTPINSFRKLWISINGEESWDLNPWVWVIEFKKIDKK